MAAPLQEMSTRKRNIQHTISDRYEQDFSTNDIKSKKEKPAIDGTSVWVAIFIFNFLLYALVRYRTSVLPEPKQFVQDSAPDEFYESNAEKHLEVFTRHGPRVVGSKANEIYAYNYILNELKNIQKNALPSKRIKLDEQNVTGSFDIAFLSDFVSYYRNIKNIVALLEPDGGSEHSLLMSCHFDSAVESPGKWSEWFSIVYW